LAAISKVSAAPSSTSLESVVRALTSSKVLVGIPQSSPPRPPEPGVKNPPTNALIGYVMETGDPHKNIPARPFLVPGVSAVTDKISARMSSALKAALKGDFSSVNVTFERVGADCVSSVKATILAGDFIPLADVTVQARADRRNKQTGKLLQNATAKGARKELKRRGYGLAPSTEFAKPLYDTHSLFNSIQYVVVVNGT
jgi:hypothetical protein